MQECDAVCYLICRQPTSTKSNYCTILPAAVMTAPCAIDFWVLDDECSESAAQGSADLRVRQCAIGGKDATEFLSLPCFCLGPGHS